MRGGNRRGDMNHCLPPAATFVNAIGLTVLYVCLVSKYYFFITFL